MTLHFPFLITRLHRQTILSLSAACKYTATLCRTISRSTINQSRFQFLKFFAASRNLPFTKATSIASRFAISSLVLDQFIRTHQHTNQNITGVVHAVSISQLGSNEPIEDRYRVWQEPNGQRMMFLVADGHGGIV